MMAQLDPNRALALLQGAQLEGSGAPSPKMQLAQRVFGIVVERDGIKALPLLEQEAEQMGAKGEYPYAALGRAASQAVAKDWHDNPKHAVEVLRSVFEPAFARYSATPQNYPSNYDFGQMLQVLAGGLPFEMVKPALRAFVNNLLATDISQYKYQGHLYTADGQDFKADNAIDAALLFFGPLINRDPELAHELESTRPELQTTLERVKTGGFSGSFGRAGEIQNPHVPDPDAETRAAALRLAHGDPDLAIAKAEQVSDSDKRTATKLDVARGMAGEHPERAAQLIGETQTTGQAGNAEMQLNVISAQVSVAAAQDQREELRQLLERAFGLANQLVSESQTPWGMQLYQRFIPLVQIGMQNDPDLATAFVQGLSPARLKAELLLSAADALEMPMRLPFGSRPRR
jgi:hypothetical protein